MRKIKFRAWDGEKIVYSFLIARAQFADALQVLTDEAYAQETYGLLEWKVMEYAGINDKRNKEIFEGDIVKYKWCGKPILMEIRFKDGEFIAHPHNTEGIVDAWDIRIYGCEKVFKIVGNIYENPKLLKGK